MNNELRSLLQSLSVGAFAWCAAPPQLVPHFDKFLDVSGSVEWLLARKDDTLNVLEVDTSGFFSLLDTMGLWSFWSFSLLAFVLLYPFHPKFVAQAEISSPRANDRFYRLEVTPLEARVTRKSAEGKVHNSTKVLRAFESEEAGALNPNNGNEVEDETESGDELGNKTAPNCPERFKIPGKKCSEGSQMRLTENIMSFPDTRKRIKRNVGATYTENMDRSISGESKETFVETVQGVPNSRSEYRRSGEEARGSNPRQGEPHLDTSTFALSGDSAHNQAMVHWSGHNSSVSFSFTKPLLNIIKALENMQSPQTLIRIIFSVWNANPDIFYTWICHILRTAVPARMRGLPTHKTNYFSLAKCLIEQSIFSLFIHDCVSLLLPT